VVEAEYGRVALGIQGFRVALADRSDSDVCRLRKLDRTKPIGAAVALALAVQGATLETAGTCTTRAG
jgi:hypothetical protein